MVHQTSELVHVRTDSDTIASTPNHPFWVRGRGWVDAGLLASGDTLVLADGGRADIVSVTREKLASPVDVYNLEVEDYHTYFVASSGVWVHNCGESAASVGNYRANFYAENPDTPTEFQIHHSLPQKYGDMMADEGINVHNTEYLRGVSRPIHQLITSDWSAFDRGYGGAPPASSIHQFAGYIDQQYGAHLIFPN